MLKELFSASKPKPQTQAQAPKPAAPAPTPRPDSAVGANARMEGTLRAEGSVRVDGTFIGDISAKGRILIGEQGKIEGNLIAEAVDSAGVVKGNVIARKVSVTRTGRIWGDLRLEKLMTEEGGFIQGLVTMEESVDIASYLPGLKEEPESAQEKQDGKQEEPKAEVEAGKAKAAVKANKN